MKSWIISIFILIIYSSSFSQTNNPYKLSNGDYIFKFWNSNSLEKTYPNSMVLYWTDKNHNEPYYDVSSLKYDCGYNLETRSRFVGLDADGIGFATSEYSQFSDCYGEKGKNRFAGSVLLRLNTIGRKDIQVRWTGGTIDNRDGIKEGTYRLRLQYRTDANKSFSDLDYISEYKSSKETLDSIVMGPEYLPSVCNNKDLLELRWILYENSKTGGTKPIIRLDDIIVTSHAIIKQGYFLSGGNSSIQINSNQLTIDLNNYYTSDVYEINLLSIVGEDIFNKFTNDNFIRINIASLVKGMYIVMLRNIKNNHTTKQILFIQ